jgi:protein SCO1/2
MSGGEIIRVRAHRARGTFQFISTLPQRSSSPRTTPERVTRYQIMSAPCRLAVGVTRTLENSAAPRIARRTFASHSSNSISAARAATNGSLRCLRETQRSTVEAGKAVGSVRTQTRSFTQSASRSKLKTIDQIRARNRGGVCLPIPAIYKMDSGHGA